MLIKILTRLCLLSLFLLGGGLQVLLAQPANDACANATSLVCGAAAINGTTVGTVAEAASPGGCSSRYGVWYTFIGDGAISAITSTTTFDHAIYVASGTCGALTTISCGDRDTDTETVWFPTTAGTTYYIYIAYFSPTGTSTQTGTFTIARICVTNDACANATPLVCGAAAINGATTGTVAEAASPGGCSSRYGVWYTFTGDGSISTITSTTTPPFAHAIYVASGTCGALTTISCTNNSTGTEITSFPTTAGTTYYIYIAYFSPTGTSTQTGTFTIARSCAPPVPNDFVCDATLLTVDDPTPTCVNISAATATATDPTFSGCTTVNNTVWYKFTPTTTGNYTIETTVPAASTNPLNARLYLYTVSGTCPGTLTFNNVGDIVCSTAGGTTAGAIATATASSLTAGTTYYLHVIGYATDVGDICLRIITPPVPPGCATLNTPANGATNVPLGTLLTWTAPATGIAPAEYKVYFGTANPPNLITIITAPATSYTPATTYNKSYYWYVVPRNAGGDAVGCNTPVFTFTTGAAPAAPAFDECTGAISITNGAAQFINPGPQSVESATQSLAPINCNASGLSTTALDVWYKFTTDANGGDVSINIVPTTAINIVVEAFTTAGMCSGASVCANEEVLAGPLTNGGETLIMTGLAGAATYYFRLYRYSSTVTTYSINVGAASGTALPLELKSFTGQVQGSVNVLNWETLTEKNVQFHIVERSIDGARWSEVGRVNSKGDSQVSVKYSLTDNAPLARAYYRLRSVDFDGKENLSNSIILTRKSVTFGITSVYPSPTSSNVTVQFNSNEVEKVTVCVMDMTGRLVLQQVTEAVKDINELPITLTGLQAGVYSVTVSNSTSVSTPVRFVKQ